MSEINRKKRDIISEQEYNIQTRPTNVDPTNDSPGDSQDDVNAEFQAGFNFMPDEKNEYDTQSDIPVFDRKSAAPSEIPSGENMAEDELRGISENARVVSSESPMPSKDLNSPVDTH